MNIPFDFTVLEEVVERKSSNGSILAPLSLKFVQRDENTSAHMFKFSKSQFDLMKLETFGISATIVNGEIYFIVLADDLAQKMKKRKDKEKSASFQYNAVTEILKSQGLYNGYKLEFSLEKVSDSGVNGQGIGFESVWKVTPIVRTAEQTAEDIAAFNELIAKRKIKKEEVTKEEPVVGAKASAEASAEVSKEDEDALSSLLDD